MCQSARPRELKIPSTDSEDEQDAGGGEFVFLCDRNNLLDGFGTLLWRDSRGCRKVADRESPLWRGALARDSGTGNRSGSGC